PRPTAPPFPYTALFRTAQEVEARPARFRVQVNGGRQAEADTHAMQVALDHPHGHVRHGVEGLDRRADLRVPEHVEREQVALALEKRAPAVQVAGAEGEHASDH